MARTAITVQTAKTPFETITAGDLDITLADSDSANGNSYAVTGKEILIAFNNDGVDAKTITIDSVDDEKNREADITTYSLANGDYIIFTGGMTTSQGWQQSGGVIHVDTESDDVQLAVIKLP